MFDFSEIKLVMAFNNIVTTWSYKYAKENVENFDFITFDSGLINNQFVNGLT